MAFVTDKIFPSGGLDLDSNPLKVNPGDSTGSKNIQIQSRLSGNDGVIQPVNGNIHTSTISGVTAATEQIFKVLIGSDGVTSHTLLFKMNNGTTVFTATFTEGSNNALTMANLNIALQVSGVFNLTPHPVAFNNRAFTSGAGFANIRLSNASAVGYQWILESTTLEISLVQEAYDTSVIGNMTEIGSKDLLNDLFIFSTTNVNGPETSDLTILNYVSSSGQINLTTSTDHGLTNGELIVFAGATEASNINGSYIVSAVTSNSFTLSNSLIGTIYTGAISITKNTTSVSEIGVNTYDSNSDTFTYTRLLRSSELSFYAIKQIDCDAEKTSSKVSLYYTDDNNDPRAFYYVGPYIADGALTSVSSAGIYTFGSIANESRLIQSTTGSTKLEFTTQTQSGGALPSAMYQYFVRLLTESLTPTMWSFPTNHIPVFTDATTLPPKTIHGSAPGSTTAKVNNFLVTGIPQGLFKFIELGVAINTNGVLSSYIVSRTPIETDQMTLSHTGNETGTTILSVGEFLAQQEAYQTAKNISILDSRLVLSNLTTGSSIDFSDVAKSFTHSIARQEITGSGDPTGAYVAGEYVLPENTYNYAGYMHNETYRFASCFKLKNGSITDSFWTDDITISTGLTNEGNPTDNRRVAGLPDYDLTTSGIECNVYVPYVQIHVDLSKMVNGIKLSDFIDEVYIRRVEMNASNRNIVASGLMILSQYGFIDNINDTSDNRIQKANYGEQTAVFPNYLTTKKTGQYLLSQFYTTGIAAILTSTGTTAYNSYSLSISDSDNLGSVAITAERKYAAFYAIDTMYGNSTPSFVEGDSFINYGAPQSYLQSINGTQEKNFYLLTNGNFSAAESTITVSPGKGVVIEQGGTHTFNASAEGVYSKRFISGSQNTDTEDYIYSVWENPASVVIEADANISNSTTEFGVYIANQIRQITNKFGPIGSSRYISTGASLQVTSTTPTQSTINVFGGDVYTQRSFIKTRICTANTGAPAGEARGFGEGIGFYSQNYINWQLRTSIPYPSITEEAWLNSRVPDVLTYSGFNLTDITFTNIGFDINVENNSDLPTRIAYSQLKPQGSLVDSYRIFAPLDFKDIDLSFGEITHHASVNGELFTWQSRRVQRQFFNTRATLQSGEGTEILIGSGSVMSRDGQTVTAFGCDHKWSIIKGRGRRGNDTMYWINSQLKNVVRYAGDGPLNMVDVKGMRLFFGNNLRFTDNNDKPASGNGISGVWDDEKGNVIWSVNTRKQGVQQWLLASIYSIGEVVYNNGELYTSLVNNNQYANTTDTSKWELIPHTNNEYYNEYTIVFNEDRNKFLTFYSFIAKIFMQWGADYFTPPPSGDTGKLYLHNKGELCSWYDGLIEEDGYIETMYNRDETLPKYFNALLANTEIVPRRVDINTKSHTTFMEDIDFEEELELFSAGVKNNLNIAGENDDDETTPWGNFIKIKLTFEKKVAQSFINFVIKYNVLNRYYKK